MNPSEKFLRFAAECEAMTKFARSPESKATWARLAARWIRCAELTEHYWQAARIAKADSESPEVVSRRRRKGRLSQRAEPSKSRAASAN